MTLTRQIKAGTTDVSVVIRIVDSSDGTPETGVVYNTSGIDLEYRREGAASVDITEATLAALTTAHTDGGFLHIGNGYYRLDLPDAACASGASGVLVHGTVTGMVVIGCYIELVAYDPTDTVRLGLTALPNAAADAAGGLPISDAGGLDLDAQVGTDIDSILTRLPASLVGGRIDASVGAVAANAITATAIATDAITAAKIATDAIGASELATDAVTEITNAIWAAATRTLTANTNLNDPTAATVAAAVWNATQSSHVAAGSFGEIATEIASILTDTNELQTDDYPTTLAAMDAKLDTIDNFLDTEIAAILEDTGTTIPALIDALPTAAEINAEVVDALNTDTYAEPSSVPAATASIVAKIGWLALVHRNKTTQTATTLTHFADDGSTSVATRTVSDDGTTATRGEAT